MEDKFSHIDFFLNEKLADVSIPPAESLWQSLSQSLHPMDLALYENLKTIETETSSHSLDAILSNLKDAPYPIDHVLHDKLAGLEASPKEEFTGFAVSNNKKKTSYKRLLLLLLLLGSASMGIWQWKKHNSNENASSTQVQKTVPLQKKELNETAGVLKEIEPNSSSSKGEETYHKQATSNTREKETAKNTVKIENVSGQTETQNGKQTNKPIRKNKVLEKEHTPLTLDHHLKDLYFDILKIGFPNFKTSYVTDVPDQEEIKRYKSIAKYKRSPIGLQFNLGFLNESDKNKSDLTNLHKDALQNYNQSSAKTRKGLQVDVMLNYTLGNRVRFKTGLTLSSTTVSNNFDYIYSDVPIYDSTGALLGYFTRTAQTSPHISEPIKSKNQKLGIPVQVLYRLGKFGTSTVWVGGSGTLNIIKQFETKVFSFEHERTLSAQNSKGFNLQGGLMITLEQRINHFLYFNLSLQGQYSKNNIESDGYFYKNSMFSPTLSLGFTYYPKFKLQ